MKFFIALLLVAFAAVALSDNVGNAPLIGCCIGQPGKTCGTVTGPNPDGSYTFVAGVCNTSTGQCSVGTCVSKPPK